MTSPAGNMQQAGLLPLPSKDSAVVEMGAGKGYLGRMMMDCCGVQRMVLMDYKGSFKNKVWCMPSAYCKECHAVVTTLLVGSLLPDNMAITFVLFLGEYEA